MKIFSEGQKNFRKARKIKFCQERLGKLKSYAKNFGKKFFQQDILYLNFKHKNNIMTKTFWVLQIFMERHLKEEFHVLVKELKLLDLKFFFKQFHTTSKRLDNLLAMVAPRIM